MAQLKVTVCDVCRMVGRPTKGYRIVGGNRKASVELCEEHAAPLEQTLAKFAVPPKEYIRFEDTLATMEEVAQKREAYLKENGPRGRDLIVSVDDGDAPQRRAPAKS